MNRYGNPKTDDDARAHLLAARTYLHWSRVWFIRAHQIGDPSSVRAHQHLAEVDNRLFAVGMWFTNHGTAQGGTFPTMPDIPIPAGPDAPDFDHEPPLD